MQQGYSLSNILKNTTKKQKIGFGLALVVIIILLIILIVLAASDIASNNTDGGDEAEAEAEPEEKVVKTKEEAVINGRDYTVTTETLVNKDGEMIISQTKMDKYGNVTTTDPSLITTYFPYQVMREHTSEDLIDLGFRYTLRYALRLDEENKKTINAIIEYCDVDGDKALVRQYLDSIPLDLSGYTVNYEVFAEDVFCEG